jgi:hypothetical protein
VHSYRIVCLGLFFVVAMFTMATAQHGPRFGRRRFFVDLDLPGVDFAARERTTTILGPRSV